MWIDDIKAGMPKYDLRIASSPVKTFRVPFKKKTLNRNKPMKNWYGKNNSRNQMNKFYTLAILGQEALTDPKLDLLKLSKAFLFLSISESCPFFFLSNVKSPLSYSQRNVMMDSTGRKTVENNLNN